MTETGLLSTPLYNWVILPLLIFLARVCDVTIGTVRIMLLGKGKRWPVAVLGFIEILIWLLAIRQVVFHLSNFLTYIAFATGFAAGNYVGIILEERIAMGYEVIRIITQKEAYSLMDFLKSRGFGVTSMEAEGATGKVHIIFMIVHRRDHKKVVEIIHRFNPRAFYSVEEVKSVREGVFPAHERGLLGTLSSLRKGK